MLQKGFLKSKEDPEVARATKRSRMFLIVGVVVTLSALFFMMTALQTAESFSNQMTTTGFAMVAMIVGIGLVFVSLWINFFTQNKNRRRYTE